MGGGGRKEIRKRGKDIFEPSTHFGGSFIKYRIHKCSQGNIKNLEIRRERKKEKGENSISGSVGPIFITFTGADPELRKGGGRVTVRSKYRVELLIWDPIV